MLGLLANVSLDPSFLYTLDPQVLKAVLIFAFFFIIILLFGFSRQYVVSHTLQGLWAGLVIGVVGVLIFEGVLVWGAKNFIFGEKAVSLPRNFQIVINNSQDKISSILGIKTQKGRPTAQSVVSDFYLLSPLDAELVRNSVCKNP